MTVVVTKDLAKKGEASKPKKETKKETSKKDS